MDGNDTGSERRLGSFVPAIFEDWIPANARPGARREGRAVLLFVDIVGFSKLSADLVAAHERGAEETQRLLNRLFAQIISVVSKYQGGVASIAGDALNAYWTESSVQDDSTQADGAGKAADGLARAAHLAAACATEIAAIARQSQSDARAMNLKLLLDCGPMHLTVVGAGKDQMFPILSGPLVENLPEQSKQLAAGKILASSEFVGLSSGAADYEADASGLARLVEIRAQAPERPAVSAAFRRKSQFAVPLARALIGHSDDDWVAEFRRATVLFASFSLLAPRDVERFVPMAAAVQAAIAENGGSVVQFQSDDKGLILVASWGLAVSAFEDNAERAIHSARALLEVSAQAGEPCKLGISTGNVLCGVLGGADYQQVAILSESVNLASALAMRAGGGLLVDGETMRLSRERFTFEDQGPYQPKGRAESVRVYKPTSEARVEREFGPEIVGRGRELSQLLEAFDTGPQEAPLVQVWGEAGLGKSHLGAVLAARMAERGHQTVFAYGDSLRRASAFHIWRRPFAKLLDHSCAPGQDRAARLEEVMDQAEIDEALRELLRQNVDLGGAAELPRALKKMSPDARARAGRETLVAVLSVLVQGQDTVLFFEDAHWMDSPSWQVLSDVRQALPAVGIVLLSRPVEQTDLPVQAIRMLRDETGARVTLRPLARAETDQLVCRELGISEQPPTMLDRIYNLAEGHPLYTKELAKLFVDRELVHIDAGYCHIHSTKIDLSEVHLPRGIEGAVSGRISTLAPEVQLTLKVAAVQGRNVDHEIIARSHPEPDAPIRAHLEQIHASGLMDPVSEGKSRFHHALIVDTAYSLMLTEPRRALHRQIAALYEDAQEADGEVQVPSSLVAHHWDNGGEPARALRHLNTAAKLAYQSQASAEVVAFLTRALELDAAHGPLLDADQRGMTHLSLAFALMSLGHLVATDEHLTAALSVYDKAPPDRTMTYVGQVIGHYFRFQTARRRPDDPVDKAKLNAARVYLSLSEIYYDRQDTLRSLHSTFSAMGLASASGGDSGPLATAMSQLSMSALFIPWALNGEYWKREAVAMAERLNEPGAGAWVHMTTGAYTFAKAQFAEAEALTQKAIALSEQARDHKCWEYSVANLGNIYRLQGQFRLADELDVRTYDSGHDRGVPQVKLWGITGRMKNLWALNDFEAFEESLARAQSLISDELNKLNSAASNTIAYHIFAALNHIRNRDAQAGMADLNTAMDLYEGLSDPQIYMVDPVSFILDAGHALHRQGVARDQILRVFDVMARKCAKLVKLYPSARARLALAKGDLAQMQGDLKTAQTAWRKAVTEAEALSMPFDAAMAHFRLAERGDAPAAQAEEHKAQVRACLAILQLDQPEGWTS